MFGFPCVDASRQRLPPMPLEFEHINAQVRRFQNRDQPAISVDTKKKELIGDFKNFGREWRPCGRPEEVRVHDFLDKKLGKAIPYGVYDMVNNQGWVSVGIDHDTAHSAFDEQNQLPRPSRPMWCSYHSPTTTPASPRNPQRPPRRRPSNVGRIIAGEPLRSSSSSSSGW